MDTAVSAASWMVGKALAPVTDGVLAAWADSADLSVNMDALTTELLYAQGMLDNTQGREIRSPALKQLMHRLRQLAYDADDVLDELEYFRIQDQLEGTYHAADGHAVGCLRSSAVNAKAVGKMLCHEQSTTRGVSCGAGAWPCRVRESTPDDDEDEDASRRDALCGAVWPCGKKPTPTNDQEEKKVGGGGMATLACDTIQAAGKFLSCYSIPRAHISTGRQFLCCGKAQEKEIIMEAPKLKFDRVEISKRMREIVQQLKPICAKVSTILNLELLDSRSIAHCVAMSLDAISSKKQGHSLANTVVRPITTPELVEPELYGRIQESSGIITRITTGECCDKDLTVLPIVGPGGVGKTTLTQHLYQELQDKFEVKIWICVSVNFDVHRLTQEIADKLHGGPQDQYISPTDKIEKLLSSKKFLLVLDDMWKCSDIDEWKRFLMPLKKGQNEGSLILVTTRFPVLAEMVKTTDKIDLEGLDHEAFKELFLACVFDDKQSINDHKGLLDIGYKIMEKLKGNPLAAKTVGRLLKNHLELDHWTRVLESKEWASQTGDHDIMPALKLSYDYLPFHLQQCFTYCALFPEDYKYDKEELVHFWIGLDILNSSGENKRIEDIGLRHLEELINHGFFKMEEKEHGVTCYVIHDLLHELALKVSSQECLSIDNSNVRSLQQIPSSIRHLSINIDDTWVKDRKTFNICRDDLSTLDKKLKVENLQSLMLFGKHNGSFVKIFHGLFREAKALRVISLFGVDYSMEDLLENYSKLIHLRYLRIVIRFPIRQPFSNISRFYHLRVLDLKQCSVDNNDFPRNMSKLTKLRHFLVRNNKLHTSIFEVGKLKSLQELRRFVVQKEIQGFELRQIGHLAELGGSLCIDNLEKVKVKEEAGEAKLMLKHHLQELTLNWDINRTNKDSAQEEQVLENLEPSSNLRQLCIRGHGGDTCPSWLGENLSVINLESLHLDGVAWEKIPPIGELWLVNDHGEEFLGNVPEKTFQHLIRLELSRLPRLKKWFGYEPCQLISRLEVLVIKGCSELIELPFSHSICILPEQETNMTSFPRLRELEIEDCPKLLSLPLVPWTSAACTVKIAGVGLGFESLVYERDYKSEYTLSIEGKETVDRSLWKMLAFCNLTQLKKLEMTKCPPMLLDDLEKLSSLKTLCIYNSSNAFRPVEGNSYVGYQFPVEDIIIRKCGASGKELTQVLSYFPRLSMLQLCDCNNITGLGVMEQQAGAELESSESQIGQHQQQDKINEEEITASAADGPLLLPPRLKRMYISDCPKLLSSCSFPSSLQILILSGVGGMETPAVLSNLASLAELIVKKTPNLFRGSELPQSHEQGLPPHSSQLSNLQTDDIAGFLSAPIIYSSSLTKLTFTGNTDVERFTKEQAEALPSLTSLHDLVFLKCDKLQCLPTGLHRLTNLKSLMIFHCPAIRSLPKEGLPISLNELRIWCSPAIRSLPKIGLLCSLRVLDVRGSSEELKRQCHKLKGTIPVAIL